MAVDLIVDLFVSVDGWAGGDHLPGYFGYDGPDLRRWVAHEKRVPELIVMGRRTCEAFEALPAEAWTADRERLMQREKVVFSRTLNSVPWPNTRICRDLVPDIRRLKQSSPIRLRTWGSMSLAGQLVAAGLVDALRLMRFPLLAGEAGRQAAFADMPSADLALNSTQVLDHRLILEEYRPTGDDIPRG